MAPRLFKAHWSLAPLPPAATTPAAPSSAARALTAPKDVSLPSPDGGGGPTSGQTAFSVYVSCTTGGASYLTPSETPNTAASVKGTRQVIWHLAVHCCPEWSSTHMIAGVLEGLHKQSARVFLFFHILRSVVVHVSSREVYHIHCMFVLIGLAN